MFWKKLFRKNKDQNHSEFIESGTLKAVVLSDLGNIRTNNEDVGMFYRIADDAITNEKGYLLMVADGMGGHKAGEVASKLAVETVSKEYFRVNGNDGNIEKKLAKAFAMANKRIFELASSQKSMHGMGTTCTALVVVSDSVYFAHAGDSRAYFFKKRSVERITEDHTYVQELVKLGEIRAEEADTHPKRNILTNAMGTKVDLRVDTGKCESSFEIGDRLMLCSDGLYDYFSDEELAEIVGSNTSLQETAEYLISETKKRGAHDNITVVLAEKFEIGTDAPARETRDFDIPQTKEYDLP
jgi:Serine/threonine protein phosphatase